MKQNTENQLKSSVTESLKWGLKLNWLLIRVFPLSKWYWAHVSFAWIIDNSCLFIEDDLFLELLYGDFFVTFLNFSRPPKICDSLDNFELPPSSTLHFGQSQRVSTLIDSPDTFPECKESCVLGQNYMLKWHLMNFVLKPRCR